VIYELYANVFHLLYRPIYFVQKLLLFLSPEILFALAVVVEIYPAVRMWAKVYAYQVNLCAAQL